MFLALSQKLFFLSLCLVELRILVVAGLVDVIVFVEVLPVAGFSICPADLHGRKRVVHVRDFWCDVVIYVSCAREVSK